MICSNDAADETLVDAANSGCIDAFGALYERYFKYCFAIAISEIGDWQLAEDAVSEAFASAAKGLRQIKDGASFQAWIATIIRRTAQRLSAQSKNHRSIVGEPIVVPSSSDIRLDVREAIKILDKRSRESIYLHYFAGMSYRQIATLQHSTPAAVHGCLQRARRKLKSFLNDGSNNYERRST